MIGLSITSFAANLALVPIALLAPKRFQFGLTLVTSLINNFTGNPVGSLLDGIVCDQVSASSYGKLNLWCVVGHGTAAAIVAIVALYINEKISWVPYVAHFAPALVCALINVMLMCFLDESESQVPRQKNYMKKHIQAKHIQSPAQGTDKEPLVEPSYSGFFDRLASVPKNLETLLFTLIVFLCGVCMGTITTFLFIFVQDDLHGDRTVMGIDVFVTSAFEVPLFYFAENILNILPTDWVLLIALVAYVIRFGMYWLLGTLKANPWWILLPESLNCLTYSIMWCCAILKTATTVEGLGLTNFAMGLITAILTLGNGFGSLVSGSILKTGVNPIFIWEYMTLILTIISFLWYLKNIYQTTGMAKTNSTLL